MKSSGSARTARRNAALSSSDASTDTVATAANGRAKTATKPKDPIRQTKRTTKAAGPAARTAAAPKSGTRTREDKDGPLFEDIRFLGRLLGDVVREQEGDTVFDVVETIRQTAVKFRRGRQRSRADARRSCAS